MGFNSHRPDINENAKPFSSKITYEQYDLRVLSPEEYMAKYKVGKCKYARLQKELNS